MNKGITRKWPHPTYPQMEPVSVFTLRNDTDRENVYEFQGQIAVIKPGESHDFAVQKEAGK